MLALHLDSSVDMASRKSEFLDRSAAWIISRFGLTGDKTVADFGCGPGLYASRLAGSGAAVTGIDFSKRSIDYAREQAKTLRLPISYIHSDYLEFVSDNMFDLIVMIMCDYCALSPTQRRALLDKFRIYLKPGGAVLLDVYSPAAFEARKEAATYAQNLHHGFWSSNPYFGFANTFKYEAERVVLDKYTIVESSRTRIIYNWFQHFDRDSLRAEIEGSRLCVEEYPGDVAGSAFDPTSQEFAVIIRKSPEA